MKHRVHLYVITRVAIECEAPNDLAAINAACEIFDTDRAGFIARSEYAEQMQEAIVGVVGKPDIISRAYSFDGDSVVPA